ncbi:MAG: 50S ribosomal protein L20 [Planctomycetes bacterium]|nr:50S ribosomal protein L20 [Planctomycetota bacterium]
MPRAKVGHARHKRHKKVMKAAKGFVGGRSKLYRTARETLLRAGRYAFRDRKARKREFRALWITRISAAARERGLNYSRLMNGLLKAKVAIDRKILADMAVNDAASFDQIVSIAKAQLA